MAPQKFYHIFRFTDVSIEPLNLSDWDGIVNHGEFNTEREAEEWIATYFTDANYGSQYRLVILPIWQVNSKK
ncbi:MAG TPA: hypothetical protein VG737_11065 [Cyclobacteriaceae bacterium]|nr:hypothetical protein [Cyclobacteriaceae bacterium]